MNCARAIALTVENIRDLISSEHFDDDLRALSATLRATLRAVDEEFVDRIAAQGGHPPASRSWPDESEGASSPHPLISQALAAFAKEPRL